VIKNQEQYENTRRWIARFEEALSNLPVNAQHAGLPELATRVQADAYRAQIEELRSQLSEYDRLRSNPNLILEIPLDHFGRSLIQARIAANLDEDALAAKLGWPVARVLELEHREYEQATLAELQAVAQAVGLATKIRFDTSAA
jgi:hypothetical protein